MYRFGARDVPESTETSSDERDIFVYARSEDPCVVCQCENDSTSVRPKVCQHVFHLECIRPWIKSHQNCPTCRASLVYHVGFQPTDPNAFFRHDVVDRRLPGYDCKSIRLKCFIPSGLQHKEHPAPGQPYRGLRGHYYLPDTAEGHDLVRLLKLAWKRRLLFRIRPDTWSDGYHVELNAIDLRTKWLVPDPSYIMWIRADLGEVGIH